MKLARSLSIIGLLAILCLLATTTGASGQVPEVLLRGHFSGGDGCWNAEDFGWFYYDLDNGSGSECLQIVTNERHVDKGDLTYTSKVWAEKFEFEDWGCYQSVAFLGKQYLAGYPNSNFTEKVSSLEDGDLREILIDDDKTHTITSNSSLILEDGYQLEVVRVSSEGDRVYFALLKNKKIVDDAVVSVGDTYVYKVGDDDLPVLLVHVAAAMQGSDLAIVYVDGLFQLRNPPRIKLKTEDVLGLMEVTDLSDKVIKLENHEDLTLHRGNYITLVGGLMLKVRDDPSLVYYPVGIISEYGVHEIRGPVYTQNSSVPIYDPVRKNVVGSAEARWNYENFSGFYFDDDNNIGSESLILFGTDGRNIMPIHIDASGHLVGGLQYASFVEPAEFEFKDWGYYNVVCLLGQMWFAGYGSGANLDIKKVNMMEYNQIGQVLIDTDQEDKASAGEVYFLKEDYKLYVRDLAKEDVEEDKIFIELMKDDELVDSAVIRSNSTYVYKINVGDVDDLPIIILHVGSIFRNEDEQFAIIDGLFQVSDHLFLPIDLGNEFGEMKILFVNPIVIFMANTDAITLKRDSDVSLWWGMNIAVADNDTLRYYLYTKEYVVPPPRITSLNLPQNDIPSGNRATFSMNVLAGAINSVSAEIVNSDGQRMAMADLTSTGIGSEDHWFYSLSWNTSILALSDDGTPLFWSELQAGMLYLNESSSPIQVIVKFDPSGRMALIQDDDGVVYYVSRSAYEAANPQVDYEDMLNDDDLRSQIFKVAPNVSKIKFYNIIDDNLVPGDTNHTLVGSLESLEPHLMQISAPPGRYELRVIVANTMDTLHVTELYFNVSGYDRLPMSVGSAITKAGENVTILLNIGQTEYEKRIEIIYDPAVLTFEDASGCLVQSQVECDGEISLTIPGNCTTVGLTFRANQANVTTEIGIAEVEGFEVQKPTNGTITILAGEGKKEKSSAIGVVVALAALCLVAGLIKRRH
ncbi:MAG: S-layer protein domain-containing protein [Methanotrichaceae archaeon]